MVINTELQELKRQIETLQSNLIEDYDFERFLCFPSNQVAYDAAKKVILQPIKTGSIFYLYGPTGYGKTHLMQALGKSWTEIHGETGICAISAERLFAFTEGSNPNTWADIHDFFGSFDLLLLDDIQFLSNKNRIQEILRTIFVSLLKENKHIFITSVSSPSMLSGFTYELITMFETCTVAELGDVTECDRLRFLQKIVHSIDYPIGDDVLVHIAHKVNASPRVLQGFLCRAIAFAEVENQPISMDYVIRLLKEY